MKTNKAIQPSVAITLDDIVFSNRNQTYGAYYLRKKYNKHLLIALTFVTFILGSAVGAKLINDYFKTEPPVINNIPIVDTIIMDSQDFKIPDPPKEPTTEPNPDPRVTPNGPPVVVDDPTNEDTIKNTMPIADAPTSSHHIDSSIYAFTGKGHGDDGDGIDNSPPVIFVDEPATFNGGDVKEFCNWVQNNINYPEEALSSNISGKVNVTFVINKKGEISDIKIIRGVHPSIDNETLRILLSSPKWTPAKHNGRIVRQLFSIPVKFTIN